MKKYLHQLIADMEQAAKNLPSKPYYDIPAEAEGIEYVVEWENAKSKPMQEWFGIAKENFPPPDKLTDEELKRMVDEILKLWEAYHFDAALPDDLPPNVAYKVLTDYFDKPVAWVSEGTVHIEFCDYDPEHCPFPKEFCWCRKIETDDEHIDAGTDNSAEIAMLDREIKEIEAMGPEEFLPEKKMVRYVKQLIGDIHKSARSFLKPGAMPGTAEGRGDEDNRQMMLTPFETLEELTGIEAAVFPTHIDMDGLQTRKVLRAMLHLLDTCNLKVYFPKEAPHEIKYETLRENWDSYQVKYLPLSGDEIDFCTGDPQTCPFGEFCNCDEEFDVYELPEKFASCINPIAQSIYAGYTCYFNPDTLEMVEIKKPLAGKPNATELEDGTETEKTKPEYQSWDNCYVFEPLDADEFFKIMEAYTESLEDEKLKNELNSVLHNKKSLSDFERIIDAGNQGTDWFLFIMKRMEDHVKQIIHNKIYKNTDNENRDDIELPF